MADDPIEEGRAAAQAYHGPGGAGFQNEGKLNAYQCERCGAFVVTVDREPGVTSYLVGCRSCGGMASSAMYRVGSHHVPTYEWIRPESVAGLAPSVVDHVRRGGLIMRPINPQAADWNRTPIRRA